MNFNVLKSIFLRKGGEGLFTKIASDRDLPEKDFEPEEKLIIRYDDSNHERLFITNKRILFSHENTIEKTIAFEEIMSIDPIMSIYETQKEGVGSIYINTTGGVKHKINIEKGLPFDGLLQVLFFVINKNQQTP